MTYVNDAAATRAYLSHNDAPNSVPGRTYRLNSTGEMAWVSSTRTVTAMECTSPICTYGQFYPRACEPDHETRISSCPEVFLEQPNYNEGYSPIKKLRIVTLGIPGGRWLTRPLRDARRFPSTRWYPYRRPNVRRWSLGFVHRSRTILCRAVPNLIALRFRHFCCRYFEGLLAGHGAQLTGVYLGAAMRDVLADFQANHKPAVFYAFHPSDVYSQFPASRIVFPQRAAGVGEREVRFCRLRFSPYR
jgi:hypothetical protein